MGWTNQLKCTSVSMVYYATKQSGAKIFPLNHVDVWEGVMVERHVRIRYFTSKNVAECKLKELPWIKYSVSVRGGVFCLAMICNVSHCAVELQTYLFD